MIPAEIIEKKRDGKNLKSNEIKWFIDNIVKIKSTQVNYRHY